MLLWSVSFVLLTALLFTLQYPETYGADQLQHGHYLTDYLNNNIDYSDDTGVTKIVKALQSNIIQVLTLLSCILTFTYLFYPLVVIH